MYQRLQRFSVVSGGTILDAENRRNGKQVWGNASPWCDYSGIVDGQHTGITVMCHPDNFRPSWMHARDYGVLVANPFGRKAFRKGPASKVVVKPGSSFRLRNGVLVHADAQGKRPDLKAAFADYIRFAQSGKERACHSRKHSLAVAGLARVFESQT